MGAPHWVRALSGGPYKPTVFHLLVAGLRREDTGYSGASAPVASGEGAIPLRLSIFLTRLSAISPGDLRREECEFCIFFASPSIIERLLCFGWDAVDSSTSSGSICSARAMHSFMALGTWDFSSSGSSRLREVDSARGL